MILYRSVLSRQTSCLQKVITFPLSQTFYKNTYIREKVSFAEDAKMLAWYCGAVHREGRRVEEDQEEERGRSSTAQQEH